MKTRYPLFLSRAGKAGRNACVRLARLAIQIGASGIAPDFLIGGCCMGLLTGLMKSRPVRFFHRFS